MVTETQLPTSKHFRLEKLAEGVYAALAIDGGGAMCNAGIVDLGDRALVFDTFWTPEASQDLLTAAEQLTGHAVVYIVNSHYNADHVNGNQVFAPATTIISTSRTRELLIERGNGFLNWAREHLAEEVHEDEKKLAAETNEDRRQQMALDLETTRALLHALPTLELRLPNFTFEHRLDLHGPARSIELRCLGGGHTESDAFLYLPQDHILFTGDLLFTQMHPSMWHDQPETWISILARMEELKTDAVVPGHGPLGTREDVTLLRQYLTWLLETARAVIKREGLADDLVREQLPEAYARWKAPELFEQTARAFYRILANNASTNQ